MALNNYCGYCVNCGRLPTIPDRYLCKWSRRSCFFFLCESEREERRRLICGNKTSLEGGGLAGTGDLCLRLWEASDLSVTLVELNYKHSAGRTCSSDATLSLRGSRNFKCREDRRLCLGDWGCCGFILSCVSVLCWCGKSRFKDGFRTWRWRSFVSVGSLKSLNIGFSANERPVCDSFQLQSS